VDCAYYYIIHRTQLEKKKTFKWPKWPSSREVRKHNVHRYCKNSALSTEVSR